MIYDLMPKAELRKLALAPSPGNLQSPPTVSALVATFAGERATWLAEALESVLGQSFKPSQLVLVVDGPVPADQEAVIARYEADRRIADVVVVRIAKNRGLANALNVGLERCTGEWVMRMDSDDICVPDRLRTQLAYAQGHPAIDVVTSWSEWFTDDDQPRRLKSSPIQHDAIVQSLRWRNVLVHPTLLIRAHLLRRVGGYRTRFGKLEDYDLYVRLFLAGARFHTLPVVLVHVRTSRDQSARRGGWRYCLNEIGFRTYCLREGFLDLKQYVAITSLYIVFRLLGASMRSQLYGLVRT